jgi:hypothetical protein
VGTVLIVGSISSFFIDMVAKKKFFDETLEKTVAGIGIAGTGIIAAYENSTDINYREELRDAKDIVLHFTYSDSFLKRFRDEIEKAIGSGASFSFLMLSRDSNIQNILTDLGWSRESRESSWRTIDEFFESHKGNEKVQLVEIDQIPRYAAVVIDSYVYVIEHTLSSGRRSVPAMKFRKASGYGAFYLEDLEKARCDATG